MKYRMRQFSIFIVLSCLISTACSDRNAFEPLNTTPIVVEAYFMQYACGDWNDDMRVTAVEDSSLIFLLDQDIDPLLLDGPDVLNGCFFAERGPEKSERHQMEYRLRGYISRKAVSGCDNCAPRFWITEITHPDGTTLNLEEASYESRMR